MKSLLVRLVNAALRLRRAELAERKAEMLTKRLVPVSRLENARARHWHAVNNFRRVADEALAVRPRRRVTPTK